MLLGVAEMDKTIRQERQATGIAAAKGRGAYAGRQGGTRKAKPQEAEQLRLEGLTIAEIARTLGVAERTVHRYLEGKSGGASSR